MTSVKKVGVSSLGRATCTKSFRTQFVSCAVLDAMCNVMLRAFGGVPHHFGLVRSTMAVAETFAMRNGPPERSIAGSTVLHDGFHPAFSMMWAGSRLANSICQSANG